MTDTEFADQMKALGVASGRVELATAICAWVTQHPSILISPAANDMAKDLVAKCQQVIKDVA